MLITACAFQKLILLVDLTQNVEIWIQKDKKRVSIAYHLDETFR